MTTLLDACAVVAFLRDEPAAKEVRPILESGESAISALNAAEVLDQMVRGFGAAADDIEAEFVMLGVSIMPVPTEVALDAARIRSAHYHRTSCPVSLADCVAVAAAGHGGTALATSDPPLARVSHRLGVHVLALPNSSGSRPDLTDE